MKALKITLIVLAAVLSISAIFFIKDYIDKYKKYNEFKAKVEQITKDNEKYISDNSTLLTQAEIYKKEKEELAKKLAEKKIEIVYKEKIIYKDGQLIIPSDYSELKDKYSQLSDLYQTQKTLNSDLEIQLDSDKKIISDLSLALDTTNKKLKETTDLLNNTVNKPTDFFSSSVLLSITNQYEFGAGYMLTIKDKFQIGTIVSYPLKVQAFVGIKL